jgi:hypothetical protein
MPGWASPEEPATAPIRPVPPGPPPPMSGPPMSGPPISGPPISGPPMSGPPMSGPPMSGPPMSGPPISGAPAGSGSLYGTSASGPSTPDPYGPGAARPWTPEPAFPGEKPSWQPRITPSPPQRGKLGLGLLVGLLVGLIVAGPGGYLLRLWTAEERPVATGPTAAPAPSPGGSPSLRPYEASQLELNRAKFDGNLAAFAESWLPWMGGCTKNGEPGGPRLSQAERTRIFCEIGGLNVFFVEYTSVAERDKARLVRSRLNIDARQITPGVSAPAERTGRSGAVKGTYVEYAFREGAGTNARPVCSIWWDDADTPVAGFLQSPWSAVGEKWGPIRDVWERYS